MLRSSSRLKLACLTAMSVTLSLAGLTVTAQADISFAGKKIEMYIGSSPGGGTDLSSRLLGDVIVKYLPGQPTVVYRNIPGGQGVMALNHVAARVKPDGLGIVGGSQAHIDPGAKKQSAVQYDPLAFAYFGGFSRGGTVMVMRKEALGRLQDRGKPPVVVPGLEVAATGPQMALWGMEYLGWNVKFVIGYPGASAMIMAVRQGEADVLATSSALQIKPLLEDSKFFPYVQFGDLDDSGRYVERSTFPGVPIFADMMGANIPPAQREIFLTWLQTQCVDKWFALPPGAAPEIVAAYGAAFDKAMGYANFARLATVQLGEDFKPISAKNMTELVHGMVSKSEIMLAHMIALRRKHGLPTE
jgi:hypothetical protein